MRMAITLSRRIEGKRDKLIMVHLLREMFIRQGDAVRCLCRRFENTLWNGTACAD
jgi:hypothetical protein